jgi:hypothetical protein
MWSYHLRNIDGCQQGFPFKGLDLAVFSVEAFSVQEIGIGMRIISAIWEIWDALWMVRSAIDLLHPFKKVVDLWRSVLREAEKGAHGLGVELWVMSQIELSLVILSF